MVKIIAVILARGGSKRVPRKNIKLLAGKPLIAYSIQAAVQSKYLDRVIVSTDDVEIADVAKQFGADVPFLRPDELANDTATSLIALQHAVKFIENNENDKFDLVVLIQATSPLILSEDVDKTIEKSIETNHNSCTTVCEISERPEWMYIIKNNHAQLLIQQKDQETRTQLLPKVYRLTGAVYVIKRDTLMEKGKILDNNDLSVVIIPKERSIDISDFHDFIIAEALIKGGN